MVLDCTLSDMYAAWLSLQLKVAKLTHELTKEIDKEMDNRKDVMENPTVFAAVFLDLRYKNLLSPPQQQSALCELSNLHDRLTCINEPVEVHERTIDELDLLLMSTDPDNEQAGVIENATLNLLTALNEFKNRPRCTDLKKGVFQQWEEMKESPLYPLANVILSIPATQATIERANSSLSFVYSNRRAKLSTETLDNIMIVHLNKDVFDDLTSAEWQKILNYEKECNSAEEI